MKILILILTLIAITAGCSKSPDQVIPCVRFTDLSETHYRVETGIMNGNGFVPTTANEFTYSAFEGKRAEIQAVSGKQILEKALWIGLGSPSGFKCSKESYPVKGVPFVTVHPVR